MSQHHVTALPTIEVAGTTDLQLQQVNQCVSVYVGSGKTHIHSVPLIGISNHPTCIDNAPTKNHEWSKLEEAGHVYFNTDDDERILRDDQLDNMKTECANISVQQRQSIFNTEVPNADRKADTAARQQTYVFGANPFLADNKVPWNYAECPHAINFLQDLCKFLRRKVKRSLVPQFMAYIQRDKDGCDVQHLHRDLDQKTTRMKYAGQLFLTVFVAISGHHDPKEANAGYFVPVGVDGGLPIPWTALPMPADEGEMLAIFSDTPHAGGGQPLNLKHPAVRLAVGLSTVAQNLMSHYEHTVPVFLPPWAPSKSGTYTCNLCESPMKAPKTCQKCLLVPVCTHCPGDCTMCRKRPDWSTGPKKNTLRGASVSFAAKVNTQAIVHVYNEGSLPRKPLACPAMLHSHSFLDAPEPTASFKLVRGEIVTIGPDLLFALVVAPEDPNSETKPVVERWCEYTAADACQTYDMLLKGEYIKPCKGVWICNCEKVSPSFIFSHPIIHIVFWNYPVCEFRP